MNPADRVALLLQDAGVSFEPVQARAGRELLQRWRRIYAAEVHRRTGRWTYAGYEWHAFSWGFSPHLSGSAALDEYLRTPLTEHCVYVASGWSGAEFVFQCEPCRPVFRHPSVDVLTFPSSLVWTAAFSHEGIMGPYFSVAPVQTGES